MKLAVSPAQRLCLFNITYAEGQKYKGQEGRRFRRFCRHLGLDAISAAARQSGRVKAAQASDDAPRLFEVDAEDIERIVRLDDDVERNGQSNEILGPLFDLAAELKAERPVELPDAAEYDPKAEDWHPEAA